jgi:hypothetical protein
MASRNGEWVRLWRRNPDEGRRGFERAAAGGDLAAAARWVRERQRAGEAVTPRELIGLGLAVGLERLPYDKRGNHVIRTLHKTFDRQTRVIAPGSVVGPTQYSNTVRPFNLTLGPGGDAEPGRLQEWDLHIFPMLDPFVRQFVVNHTEAEGAIVYLFSVGEPRRFLGYVVTREDGQLMGRFSRGDAKSRSVIEAVTPVVSWQLRPEFQDLKPFGGKHGHKLPMHAMNFWGRLNPPFPSRRNPDPRLRAAERASAAGDPEATLDYGRALLRAGQLDGPSAAVVGAGLILAGSTWTLHRFRDGWVLRRMLPGGWQITVAGDPELLDYTGGPAGPAVGWLNTPLVHFRTDPVRVLGQHRVGRGVVHGKNLADPKAFAAATHDLGKPSRRLLGALTLAADEGLAPRAYGLDSLEEVIENQHPPGSDLEGILYSGAATRSDEFENAESQVEELLDGSKVWRGGHQGAPRLLWPVNAFNQYAFIPFPEILAALGFDDQSWGNDSAARATLPVYGSSGTGSKVKPRDGSKRIEWYGDWPELAGDDDHYQLTVWCNGLHPSDQESSDGIRYTVVLDTEQGGDQVLINDEIQNENALAMILLQLGLNPSSVPRWA